MPIIAHRRPHLTTLISLRGHPHSQRRFLNINLRRIITKVNLTRLGRIFTTVNIKHRANLFRRLFSPSTRRQSLHSKLIMNTQNRRSSRPILTSRLTINIRSLSPRMIRKGKPIRNKSQVHLHRRRSTQLHNVNTRHQERLKRQLKLHPIHTRRARATTELTSRHAKIKVTSRIMPTMTRRNMITLNRPLRRLHNLLTMYDQRQQ